MLELAIPTINANHRNQRAVHQAADYKTRENTQLKNGPRQGDGLHSEQRRLGT
jgi:hypothetical protein